MHVPGDGSCLFHSVNLALAAAKGLDVSKLSRASIIANSQKLRLATVNYVLRHYRRPLGDIQGNLTGSELIRFKYASSHVDGEASITDAHSYKRVMSQPAIYAGNTELVALSALLRAKIVVHMRTGETEFDAAKTGGRLHQLHLYFDAGAKHYMPYVPELTIKRRTIKVEPARVRRVPQVQPKRRPKSNYKRALSRFYPV